MNILLLLVPVALALGSVFAVLFVSAVHRGQFEDLDDPPRRMLND